MRIRLVLVASALTALCGASALAQGPKTLLIERPNGNDPIRIVKASEGTTELVSDGRHFPDQRAWESVFNAGDDWVKDLSLVIRNVSHRSIAYLEVSCVLSETADWQTEIANHKSPENPILGQASNVVGWRPEHALYSTLRGKAAEPDSTRRAAFKLGPKQEFTISLQDPKNYESLRSTVEARVPVSSMTACNSQVSTIFFDDGTMWQGHKYRRPAEQPGQWTTISFEDWSRTGSEAQSLDRTQVPRKEAEQ